MTEQGPENNEDNDPGMQAIIEHSDGSRTSIDVGPEDLLIDPDGNVVGVTSVGSEKGDTLVDITANEVVPEQSSNN